MYERAKPGYKYLNNNIPIEVREDSSLYVMVGNVSSGVRSILSPLLYFISKVAILLVFVSIGLFIFFWQ